MLAVSLCGWNSYLVATTCKPNAVPLTVCQFLINDDEKIQIDSSNKGNKAIILHGKSIYESAIDQRVLMFHG